jgi:prevent-host-death family protein
MKEISVRELKDRLSEHLRAVKGGHSIVVTSHKKPVARLSPVARSPPAAFSISSPPDMPRGTARSRAVPGGAGR